MPVLRTLLSALIVGASVWCAAGTLTVAAADSAVRRLGVPASPWWIVAGALAALAVPALRRRPALAAPALVSTLPWLPMPMPAVALLWTGPLAWLPIGLALGFGLLSRSSSDEPPARRSDHGPVVGSAVLAGVLSLLCGAVGAYSVRDRTPGGDEPHYLVITQSLIDDGDLRIENNHANRDYEEYFDGTLAPDFIRRGQDGEIYSIHAPGVSALVAPAFAVAGYRGAQATVLALSAVTGALLWLIGWHVTRCRGAAWFGWAAVALTSTLLLQSGMIFPDAPGALAVAAAMWLLVRLQLEPARVSRAAFVSVGTLLAILPWLHTRFVVLAAGFGLVILLHLVSPRSFKAGRALAFLAVPVVAAVAWFWFFWQVYGSPNPAAPYGDTTGARLAFVPGGVLGLLFDQQFGLLTYAPVLAAVVCGVVWGRTSPVRRSVRESLLVAAAYAVVVATYWMWWAGVPATPARLLTAVLPIAAAPVAIAWAEAGPAARRAFGLLLALSIVITAVTVGVDGGALAWNVRNAESAWLEWLSPVVNLPRVWPSFFWRLSPEDLATEWPFAVHVVVFVGILTAALVVGARYIRGDRRRSSALAWALPIGMMLAALAGWQQNGVGGLDPARSQLNVAAEAAAGRAVWEIAALRLGAGADAAALLHIVSDEPGRTDEPPPWADFARVPPGRYEISIESGSPAAASVRIGQSPDAVAEQPLEPGAVARIPVWLPAGAGALVVDAEPRVTGGVMLRPAELGPGDGPLARAFARHERIEAHFLDDNVFAEPAGFWVKGGSTAAWVVVPSPGQARLRMTVQNGGTLNRVVVSVNDAPQTFTLQPSEVTTVELAFGPASLTARVRVESTKGFRPSDVGPSDDRRYLGVWIQLEGDRSRAAEEGTGRGPSP